MTTERRTAREVHDLIKAYKPHTGQLLACLHAVQHHYGYIPTDAVPIVARQMRMSTAEVFGAITFYSEFRTTPPPELLVQWCSGPTCRLKGGDDIRLVFETVLGVAMEENTPDGKVGLHLQQCDGGCEYAPLVWLRRAHTHAEGPGGVLLAERGEIRGPLRVADAVEMARRLKAGDLEV